MNLLLESGLVGLGVGMGFYKGSIRDFGLALRIYRGLGFSS